MDSEKIYDVVISGAGPGGTIAAIQLAKLGIKTLVLEKEKFPRDKICGDALSGKSVEVLKKLDISMLDRLQAAPIQLGSWGVDFYAPNRKMLHVPFRKEYSVNDSAPGYISQRIRFDQFLVDEMLKYEAVTLKENTEVLAATYESGGIRIQLKNQAETILAKMIIAADGAHSHLAKKLGNILLEKEHYCGGIRAYYEGVSGMDKDNFIELHFMQDVLPGYFWIFPLPDGLANVGVGMRSDKVSSKKINLKEMMIRIVEKDPVISARFRNAKLVGDIKGFGLPLGSKKRKISGDRFLLVGDAASLIDPFTGEGIGNAMVSGMLAAQTAAAALERSDFSKGFLSGYDEAVYRKLWSELRLSKIMQEMVNYPWLFNFIVNKAERNEELRTMISCMFEDLDMRKKLKSPRFYFNLFFADDKK